MHITQLVCVCSIALQVCKVCHGWQSSAALRMGASERPKS